MTEDQALALAASGGEPVQVTSEITKTMDVWAQPDGTLSAEVSSGPVRVQDPQDPSAWVPIDTTLSDTGGSITPAAAATDLAFSDGGTDPVATMAVGENSFSLQTQDPLPAPTLEGNTATYAEVQPGVDLVVSALPEGFTESYVVDSAVHAPAIITFPLTLEGLSASVDDAGALVLTDGTGQVVAQAAPARMWGATLDAQGLPVAEQEVPVQVVDNGNGPVLQVTPDPAFFTRSDVTYPVTIDPSTDLSATADTYVRSDQTGTSYGNDDVLLAGRDATRTTRAFLHFDVSGLAGRLSVGAELKLYETGALSCSAPQMDVLALDATWSESTTWSGKPADPSADNLVGSTAATKGYSGACPSGWVTIADAGDGHLTMGDLVNEWLMGHLDNDGIELRADNESLTTTWRRFRSSEATSQTPILSVKYLTGTDAAALESLPEYAANYLVDAGSISPGAAYDLCVPEDNVDADLTNQTYESYIRLNETFNIQGDLYWPSVHTQSKPLLILAHGGGWWRGCRAALNQQAADFSQNFVVYNIDYRMACDPEESNLEGSQVRGQCGWPYNEGDTINGFGYGQPGAGIHDILNAVAWARDHVNALCDWGTNCWDGETVFVGGGSAGGNLAEVAAALGYAEGGDYVVNGVFSWSGAKEMGIPTCSLFFSRGSGICFGETNQYVCGNWTYSEQQFLFGLDPACTTDTTWDDQNDFVQAGPYVYYTSESAPLGGDLPPIFFANGGFCDGGEGGGCNEDIGWKGSADLEFEDGFLGLLKQVSVQGRVLRSWDPFAGSRLLRHGDQRVR